MIIIRDLTDIPDEILQALAAELSPGEKRDAVVREIERRKKEQP